VQLRDWMADKDASAMEQALEQAISVREQWLMDRASGKWKEELDKPGVSGTLGSLTGGLGFGVGRRKPKEK